MKKKKIEGWEGKIYDFLSPINLTMFRKERTEKVILFIKELLKSEKAKWEKAKARQELLKRKNKGQEGIKCIKIPEIYGTDGKGNWDIKWVDDP